MIEGTFLYRLSLVEGLLVDCGRYYAVPRLLLVLSLRFVIVNVCILLYQNVFIDAVVVDKSLTADLILSVYLSDHGNRIQKVTAIRANSTRLRRWLVVCNLLNHGN